MVRSEERKIKLKDARFKGADYEMFEPKRC